MNESRNIEKVIGIISDTHGLLRPEAVAALRGVELILHAGDVGGPEVLEALKGIAPVVAVRGNNDKGAWAEELPSWEVTEVGVVYIYMIHDLKEIDLSPAAAGFQVVVSGHSHKPAVEERKEVQVETHLLILISFTIPTRSTFLLQLPVPVLLEDARGARS